jgi:hypothetical protein
MVRAACGVQATGTSASAAATLVRTRDIENSVFVPYEPR